MEHLCPFFIETSSSEEQNKLRWLDVAGNEVTSTYSFLFPNHDRCMYDVWKMSPVEAFIPVNEKTILYTNIVHSKVEEAAEIAMMYLVLSFMNLNF